MAKPGLNGRTYRELRVWMKANLPWVCHRCGGAISREITAARPRSRGAWSADHHPISRAEGGPTTLANMKPAHRGCNSDAGNTYKAGVMARQANPTSREW